MEKLRGNVYELRCFKTDIKRAISHKNQVSFNKHAQYVLYRFADSGTGLKHSPVLYVL